MPDNPLQFGNVLEEALASRRDSTAYIAPDLVRQLMMETGQQPPESLAGTLMSAPAPAPAMGRLPMGRSVTDVINSAQQTNAMMSRANEEAQKNSPEIVATHDPSTGKTSWDFNGMEAEDVQSVFQALNFTRKAMESYSNEVDRLRQMEQNQMSGFGPVANALATFAGNLAINDPRLPPVVRALGQTAKDLNPTMEQLRTRELAAASGLGNMAEKQQAIFAGAESRAVSAAIRQQSQEETARHNRETEEQKSYDALNKLKDRILLRTKAVAATGNPMNEAAFTNVAQSILKTAKLPAGVTPDMANEAIKDFYAAHVDEASQFKAKTQQDQAAKKEELQYKADLKRENDIAAYGLKKDYALTTQEGKKQLMDYSNQLKNAKGLEVADKTVVQKLAGLSETEKFMDKVEATINNPKYSNLMGFSSRAMRDVPVYLKGDDRVQFENLMKHEVPRVIELMLRGSQVGGASILRTKEGREMIRALGVSPEMTVSAARGVLQNIRTIVRNQREALRSTAPLAQWDYYKELFGHDSDLATTQTKEQVLGGEKPGQQSSDLSFDEFKSGSWRK